MFDQQPALHDNPGDEADTAPATGHSRGPIAPNLRSIRYAFLVLVEHRLAYARVPKVASTSIRSELSRHVPHNPKVVRRLTRGPRGKSKYYQRDIFWDRGTRGRSKRATAFQMLNRYPGFFTFTFVRDPFDRTASCYFNKIVQNPELAADFIRHGFTKDMTFADYVMRVAEIPDEDSDPHFCSQYYPLAHKDRLVPEFIGRTETMAQDWEALRVTVRERVGLEFEPIAELNKRRDRDDLAGYYRDPAVVAAVRERYARDFEVFYPDREDP